MLEKQPKCDTKAAETYGEPAEGKESSSGCALDPSMPPDSSEMEGSSDTAGCAFLLAPCSKLKSTRGRLL